MHKIAASFFVTAVVVTLVGITAVSAAPVSTMTLSPNNTSVSTGESFALSVMVDPNGQSLDTARADLRWDPALLEVTAFDLGSQFPNASPNNFVNNVTGFFSQGVFKFGLPVTDQGVLGTVTFRALKSGAPIITVGATSKLISNGAEVLNKEALGSSTISVDGAAVAATPAPATPEADVPVATVSDPSAEVAALKYFGAFAGRLPADGAEWEALHCIAYGGCQWDPKSQPREVKALGFYTKKYGALPGTGMEWNAIHAIAYTDVFLKHDDMKPEGTETVDSNEDTVVSPVAEPNMKEAEALTYFTAITGRVPANGADWETLHCMAYGGCQMDPQHVEFENAAISLFVEKLGHAPAVSAEWNVVHAIAYTNTIIDHGDALSPVPVSEGEDRDGDGLSDDDEVNVYGTNPDNADSDGDGYSDKTEVDHGYDPNCAAGEACAAPAVDGGEVEESTEAVADKTASEEMTQEAIGWFGTLKGVLPSSSADWLAVEYMVNGFTPDVQDIVAESSAISLFSGRFNRLPSSDADWRIISAIAYSGAF